EIVNCFRRGRQAHQIEVYSPQQNGWFRVWRWSKASRIEFRQDKVVEVAFGPGGILGGRKIGSERLTEGPELAARLNVHGWARRGLLRVLARVNGASLNPRRDVFDDGVGQPCLLGRHFEIGVGVTNG